MQQIFHLLGGLGVFLLGIVVMTGGLRQLTGDVLRNALTRFTRSAASGAVTGTVSTAILQSSSATTVAAVGFVSAGLLTFPQALGIIFGANLGTTITGWLVALVGFKLQLGTLLLPLILVGVLLNLFARGRTAAAGYALAGFGLIFVGIDAMQSGMAGLEGKVTPDDFPADTLVGRLQLVALGVLITLITQSSSAGVATALTAVYTGTISFEQGAAMVIGMDMGTTVTAAMATIGGSVATRRTGFSHVIFNLLTGLGAFLLLTPYVWLWEWLAPGELTEQAEIALVAFHTGFNIVGVLLIVPFAGPFARLIVHLFPERSSAPARRLDSRFLAEPLVALETARAVLAETFTGLLHCCRALCQSETPDTEMLAELDTASDATQAYLDHLHLTPEEQRAWQLLLACMHSIDHMQRFEERLQEAEVARTLAHSGSLSLGAAHLAEAIVKVRAHAMNGEWVAAADAAALMASEQTATATELRQKIMEQVVTGGLDTERGFELLEAVRWQQRVAHHIWRIAHHLNLAERAARSELDTSEMNRREPPLPT